MTPRRRKNYVRALVVLLLVLNQLQQVALATGAEGISENIIEYGIQPAVTLLVAGAGLLGFFLLLSGIGGLVSDRQKQQKGVGTLIGMAVAGAALLGGSVWTTIGTEIIFGQEEVDAEDQLDL